MQIEFVSDNVVGDAELFLYLDAEGLKYLRDVLDRLEKRGGHDHLFSRDWGGSELTISDGSGKNSYHKLTVTLVPDAN